MYKYWKNNISLFCLHNPVKCIHSQ